MPTHLRTIYDSPDIQVQYNELHKLGADVEYVRMLQLIFQFGDYCAGLLRRKTPRKFKVDRLRASERRLREIERVSLVFFGMKAGADMQNTSVDWFEEAWKITDKVVKELDEIPKDRFSTAV